jgi:hypothetical protein
MARAPVQPGWGRAPNRGQHTAGLDDPTVRHLGLRAPSVGTLASWGKGTGASPTPMGMEWPKAVAVVVWMWGPGGGGADHHDDCSGGSVGR